MLVLVCYVGVTSEAQVSIGLRAHHMLTTARLFVMIEGVYSKLKILLRFTTVISEEITPTFCRLQSGCVFRL